MSLYRSALDVARADILGPNPIRESNGKNRSPEIDKINRGVGNPLGAPYCAAGVSHDFRAFGLDQPDAPGLAFPYSGGSQAILAAARLKNLVFTDPDELMLCHGALGGWTDPGGEHGHIFLIEKRLTDVHGHVVALQTLEYNTSPHTKGRDGEGGYRLTRTTEELRAAHPKFWFIDTSSYRGGRWFK